MKYLKRCTIVKSLSRSHVNLFLYFLKFFFCYGVEISSFGEVGTKKSVSIFIRTSFPTMVWIGKVNSESCVILYHLVLCKFSSVIKGQSCSEMLWNLWYYLFSHNMQKTSSVLPKSKLPYNEIATLSINNCQKNRFSVFPNDSVSFPVSF